jgi:hypothetical protein
MASPLFAPCRRASSISVIARSQITFRTWRPRDGHVLEGHAADVWSVTVTPDWKCTVAALETNR